MSAQIYNNAVNLATVRETETTHRRERKSPKGPSALEDSLADYLGFNLVRRSFYLVVSEVE